MSKNISKTLDTMDGGATIRTRSNKSINLSEKVALMMVGPIGLSAKSNKKWKWKIPNNFSKSIDKLEYSNYDTYKMNQ